MFFSGFTLSLTALKVVLYLPSLINCFAIVFSKEWVLYVPSSAVTCYHLYPVRGFGDKSVTEKCLMKSQDTCITSPYPQVFFAGWYLNSFWKPLKLNNMKNFRALGGGQGGRNGMPNLCHLCDSWAQGIQSGWKSCLLPPHPNADTVTEITYQGRHQSCSFNTNPNYINLHSSPSKHYFLLHNITQPGPFVLLLGAERPSRPSLFTPCQMKQECLTQQMRKGLWHPRAEIKLNLCNLLNGNI